MTGRTPDEAVLAETARILDAEVVAPRTVGIDVNDPDLLEAIARAHSHILRPDGTIGVLTDEQWAHVWPRLRTLPENVMTLDRIATALLTHGMPLEVEHGPDTIDGRPQHRHVTTWCTG